MIIYKNLICHLDQRDFCMDADDRAKQEHLPRDPVHQTHKISPAGRDDNILCFILDIKCNVHFS